jgi:hypothetical protein
MNNTGSDARGFITETEYLNRSINTSERIQPDSWYVIVKEMLGWEDGSDSSVRKLLEM